MKRNLLRILFISAISGLVIILGVYIFPKPAFISGFELTEKDKLGTAIGGLTAPVIGLISTILLYLALSKQTESNNEQRLKNESDIIFLLLNQLDSEINNFRVHAVRQDTERNVFEHPDDRGHIGIYTFCKSCLAPEECGDLLRLKKKSFDMLYESSAIILIIESYLLIEKRINSASLNADMKELFRLKIKSYYDLKLKHSMTALVKAFNKYNITHELMPKKIIEFASNR
ncbi:hypothetical protein L3C95_16270 [Chitinophaga filiformis]|uniref:hypothetical protein n=1 Tax=Chitinophaga filiformis TaxID=104663 RepID=UPI001F2B611B|nr:hypothetical protein [Chitinophaga filiformis]MCF6404454.1 hypothetical protein [Chitinophaga filiformis]